MTSPSFSLRVLPDAAALAQEAAAMVVAQLQAQPRSLLCFAAGGTPSATYAHLQSQRDLFCHARLVQLDEWCGLPEGHPANCATQIRRELLQPLGIGEDRFCAFPSEAPDPQAQCDRVARWLDNHGPIDLCILGLGMNGHLALNEPAPFLRPTAHVARLSEQTLKHPMLAGVADRGRLCGVTLGMAELLRSRRILLLVSGEHKRAGMQRLMTGELRTDFPASLLWLHPAVTVLCSSDAAPSGR